MISGCIDCGATGAQSIDWAADTFPLARCERCGLIFHARWQEELAGGATFHEGNVTYYEDLESSAPRLAMNPLNLERLAAPLDRLRRTVPSPSLLDVGCGRGEVVAVAGERGWLARGIDLAPGAIRIARGHGLPCDQLDFFDAALDDERFGLIYMSEFLEHVPQPHRFLLRARDLLLPGGILYVTTPNFSSLGRRVLRRDWSVLIPGHVTFFTTTSLCEAARAAGLQDARTSTAGISVTAIERLLCPRRPRPGPEDMARTQEFREALYASRWKRAGKTLVEPIVAHSGLGETIKASFLRP